MIASIHMENLDESEQLPTEVMEELSEKYKIPEDKQVNILFMSYCVKCFGIVPSGFRG